MTNTMGHVAAETADVLLAADGLPSHSIDLMLGVFAGMANKADGYSAHEREMFHSIARLLARVRDIHTERWEALKRADRSGQLRPRAGDPALAKEFGEIVAGLDN